MSQPLRTLPAPAKDSQPTDFNDLARLAGQNAIKNQFEQVLQQKPKKRNKTPFYLDEKGVWQSGDEGDTWICAPLHVRAMTRDPQNNEWGRLLEWHDADNTLHRVNVPAALMVGDGRDLARLLASGGLRMAPGSGNMQRLTAYVMTQSVENRARTVPSPGWHEGRYMLPSGETIGADNESSDAPELVYQAPSIITNPYTEKGDWKKHVAPLCVGNANLMMAVCIVLAGPMLRFANYGGGGFHFVGDSSTGKSTILKVAASMAGSPDIVREWRATANGLEGVATLYNDATIILDEMAQISPNEIGEAAYMLANGAGKSRSNRNGDARATAQWLTLILSAGEISLEQHMATVGKRARAGQMIRLADLPADAGQGLGAFGNLHGVKNPAAFSALLKERARKHYGGQWRPWIKVLANLPVAKQAVMLAHTRETMLDVLPQNSVPDGQTLRVLDRFALAAAAGELATEAGLTGWPTGEAIQAAKHCASAWLTERGGVGNLDKAALLAQVRAFFETCGESRFEHPHREGYRPVMNRAGFINDHMGKPVYMVLPEVMTRELCRGYRAASAKKWLIEEEWLIPAPDGRPHTRKRIRDLGLITVYIFDATAIHGEWPQTTPNPTSQGAPQ